jgi:hypothetical protein
MHSYNIFSPKNEVIEVIPSFGPSLGFNKKKIKSSYRFIEKINCGSNIENNDNSNSTNAKRKKNVNIFIKYTAIGESKQKSEKIVKSVKYTKYTFVMKIRRFYPFSFLSSAQCSKVFCCLWHNIFPQFNNDSSNIFGFNRNIQKNQRIVRIHYFFQCHDES